MCTDSANFFKDLSGTVRTIRLIIEERTKDIVPLVREILSRKCEILSLESKYPIISGWDAEKLLKVMMKFIPHLNYCFFQIFHNLPKKVSLRGETNHVPCRSICGDYEIRSIRNRYENTISIRHIEK